jgi:predicted AAA+ superfamily ATPase
VWNAAEPARSLGVGESTVRRYLDLLTGLFLARQLPPWHENLGKRQVRLPKSISGIAGCCTSSWASVREELLAHPKCGASWEGYALEETLKAIRPDEAYFWATYQGAELDLFLFKNGRRLGVEFKRMDAPRLTPSMRIALKDLRLEGLAVLHPGTASYPLGERVRVIPLAAVAGETLDTFFPPKKTEGRQSGAPRSPLKRARSKRGVA